MLYSVFLYGQLVFFLLIDSFLFDRYEQEHIMIFNTYALTLMFVYLIVFNATFNNISVISWWSVVLMEETGGPSENHRPVASH